MDVERVVKTQVTSSELNPSPELIKSVNNGETTLIAVVQALGPFLTAPEEKTRVNGLTYLSNTVTSIDKSKINRPAARTLTNFFLAKLDDFDSLSPSLSALLVLSKLSATTFDDDTAVEVYRQIVENVNMKAYAQSVRHQVYQLFDSFLDKHREAFKDMGPEFISSYSKMVDGEKDPRNLLLLFQLDKVILIDFDVESQIEDMFDVTFCYFPISFRPPPNDPYGITAEDLKVALRAAMSASPHFAKMALPLFLEKYATSSGPAMKDLLLTMAACFPAYGAPAVAERGEELWDCLKTEILYTSDSSVEAAALAALESLIRTLYPTTNDGPSGLAQLIIKQCLENMNEPEKNHSMGSSKCLAALVRASPSTGPFALSQALPQLFRQFNVPKLPSHRENIISYVTILLMAARSVYAVPGATRRQEQERSLEPYRENLLDVMREGLRTRDLKVSAVRGSVALAEIPGFWTKREVEEVVQGMDDLLINEKDPDVRPAVMHGLKTIAGVHADVVEGVTLPVLFHTLPETAPEESDVDGRDAYRRILSALTDLCTMPALFETLVVRITTRLDLLSSATPIEEDAATGASRRECTVAYAWDLLNTLQTVISIKLEAKHVDLPKYYSQVAPRLFGMVVSAALPRVDKVVPLFRDRRLITIAAAIGETLFFELSAAKQAPVVQSMVSAFEEGNLSAIVYDQTSVPPTAGSPLRGNATSAEQDLVALYSAIIRGLKADTPIEVPSISDFLATKVHWAVRVARDDFQLRLMLDLITALVNKRVSEFGGHLEPLLERIWMTDIQDTTQPFELRRRGLLVYLHITKALALLRNDLAYSSIQRIVEILSLSNLDPAFVQEAACDFGVLAESGGKGKGKGRGAHLTTKLLHAQKLWNFLLPKLIEGDKDTEGKGRDVYLVAFASLLPLVPSSLFLSDLPTILPLLLRSLSLSNAAQRANVITALTSIVETANTSTATDKLLHEHAVTMVEGVLRSARRLPGVETNGRVRCTALAALGVFPDAIRYETLHPVKATVIRELADSLDDPLRSVRREAVDTRDRWYRYGA